MNITQRKSKSKKLQELIGDFIEVILKNVTRMDTLNNSVTMSNIVTGYVIDSDEYFLYLGEDMTGYSNMVDIEEIGRIIIKEDIPEELLIEIGDNSVH